MARTPARPPEPKVSMNLPVCKQTVAQHADAAAAHSRLATAHSRAAAAGARDQQRAAPKSKR